MAGVDSSGVSLDLTDRILTDGLVLSVRAGVTLASDRGVGGSSGAVLQSDEFGTVPLIRVVGEGARISGLRLRGSDPKRRLAFHHRVFFEGEGGHDSYYKFLNSIGVQCSDGPILPLLCVDRSLSASAFV